MSDTLMTLTTRLQVLLDDPDAAIWSGEVLEECLRWALGQIQRVCPFPLTIAGLDGELQSNLDQDIESESLAAATGTTAGVAASPGAAQRELPSRPTEVEQ